jgi:hypothetical protein
MVLASVGKSGDAKVVHNIDCLCDYLDPLELPITYDATVEDSVGVFHVTMKKLPFLGLGKTRNNC